MLKKLDIYCYLFLFTGIIALTVMLGWFTGVRALIQIHPQFVPMQFNTAISFLTVSAAACCLVRDCTRAAQILSVTAFVFCGLTFSQYIFGVNYNIDELFFEHYITVKTPFPGRMALNTAACFLLSSSAVFLLTLKKIKAAGIVCGIGLSFSAVALLGYFSAIEFFQHWGKDVSTMALHTSICFACLLSGLIIYCWKNSKAGTYIPIWFPTVVFIFGVIISLVVWRALINDNNRFIENEIVLETAILKKHSELTLGNKFYALKRLAPVLSGKEDEYIIEEFKSFLNDYSSLMKMSLLTEGKILTVNKMGQISRGPAIKAPLLQFGELSLIPDFQKDQGYFKVITPLKEKGQYLMAEFDIKSLFLLELLGTNSAKPLLTIAIADQKFSAPEKWESRFVSTALVQLENIEMKLEVGASKQFIDKRNSPVIHFVLITGVLLSTLVYKLISISDKMVDKNHQLEKFIEELARINSDLERFAYITSHDLQEPLRMITNFTFLLKDEYRDKLEGNGVKYIDFSYEAAIRMSKLISGILEYSRAAKTSSVTMKNIDLNKTVAEVEANLEEMIKESGAIINKNKLPVVRFNEVQAVQLFQNIISNAIKYQPLGNKPQISVKSIEYDDYWIVSIKDNGIGIDEDYLAVIFDPFKRLHSSSEYSGSGIGLSICRILLENYGGSLNVSSETGTGSIFYLKFMKI